MNMYREALLSQSACNSSGLIHSLSKIMDQIWKEARDQGKATDYVNQHPVIRLFLEQLVFLNGHSLAEGSGISYHKASAICEEKKD